MSSKNISNTKDKALKKAKDIPKVYSQKALKSGSTILECNNLPNEYAIIFQFGADLQTDLVAKYYQKHGNPSCVVGDGNRRDIKKQEAKASSSVVHSSFNVDECESFTISQQRILLDFQISAILAEEIARSKEKAIKHAIETASCAKVMAEKCRKAADDTEKELRKASLLGCASFHETLCDFQELAALEEEIARSKEEAIEHAIETASCAKVMAEQCRKAADDTEKELTAPSLLGCASFHEILRDLIKESPDLAEEIARSKEKAVERSIKCASGTKVTAKPERLRETAEDVEISIKRFRRG